MSHRGDGTRQRSVHRQRGQTMVETALAMLLFLTVLFGIIGFSKWIRAYHFASHAAREGVRYTIVRGSKSGHPTNVSDVTTFLASQFVGIGGDTLGPVTLTDGAGGAWPAAGLDPKQIAKVTVSVTSEALVPLMPATSITVTSSSQMTVAQ